MGRTNHADDTTSKLYIQCLQLVDDDYDTGGAYWGSPDDIWCVFTKNLNTMFFIRAKNRKEVKEEFCNFLLK